MLNFDAEPDFVNEEGTKFWVDKDTTDWAQREDRFGTSLNLVVYAVENKDGYRTRLMVNEAQEIVAEDTNLEQMAVRIDMLKASKRFDDAEK